MRKIIQRPNPILNQVARPVKTIDGYIKELVGEMRRYLILRRIIGISAPQLGEGVRLIGFKRNQEVLFVVNPIIVKLSTQTFRVNEGCLSIGDGKIPFLVVRHKIVKVKGFNLDWQEVTYKGRDEFGQVLQHEIDHLNGRLISEGGNR